MTHSHSKVLNARRHQQRDFSSQKKKYLILPGNIKKKSNTSLLSYGTGNPILKVTYAGTRDVKCSIKHFSIDSRAAALAQGCAPDPVLAGGGRFLLGGIDGEREWQEGVLGVGGGIIGSIKVADQARKGNDISSGTANHILTLTPRLQSPTKTALICTGSGKETHRLPCTLLGGEGANIPFVPFSWVSAQGTTAQLSPLVTAPAAILLVQR